MSKINIGECASECVKTDEYYYANYDQNKKYKYDYLCANDNTDLQNELKKEEMINPFSHEPFIVQTYYTGGRLGNYLFSLSHLYSVYDNYVKTFGDGLNIYTNWNCTYIDDSQSGDQNIMLYNTTKNLPEFANIKCKHFSKNLFCEKYGDIIFKGYMMYKKVEYGHWEIWKDKSSDKIAILFKIFVPIPDHNYFNNDYIICNPQEKSYLMDEKNSKFVAIISFENLNYHYSIFFNYKIIEMNRDVIKKYLFTNRDEYVSSIKKHKFFEEDSIYVCMHLRAGDFSVGKNISFCVLFYHYYVDCLQKIISENPSKKLKVVFSFHPNDMNLGYLYREKILEVINNPLIKIIFENDISLTDIFKIMKGNEHLYFMSSFDYYIMSNSSYSFWSAYLSDGKVYYPNLYQMPEYFSNMISQRSTIHNITSLRNMNKFVNVNGYKVIGIPYKYLNSLHYPQNLFGNKEKYTEIRINAILSPLYYISNNLEEADITLSLILLHLIGFDYSSKENAIKVIDVISSSQIMYNTFVLSLKKYSNKYNILHDNFLNLKKEFDKKPIEEILTNIDTHLKFIKIDYSEQTGGYYYKYLKYNKKNNS
jgi:hypothetical protein